MMAASLWQRWLAALREWRPITTWRERHDSEVDRLRARKATYDAYPDQPTETARVRLLVVAKGKAQEVDLDGYSLRNINLGVPMRQRWLASQVLEAEYLLLVKLQQAEREREERRATP
jgi:hypothetical protein